MTDTTPKATDPDAEDEIPRWVDHGSSHREHVLACIAKLWDQHPDHSFCDLIDRYVISIGTMAGHTSDDEVIENCRAGKDV